MAGVDDTKVLGEDDLRDVISAVTDLAGRWKDLGISLGVRPSDLDTILSNNPHSSSDCLREMLLRWLRQSYNVEMLTWRRLVEAVEDPVGGNNHALALKIARDHPGAPDKKYRKLKSQQQSSLCLESGQEANDCTDAFSLPQYIRVMVSNYQPLQTVFAIPKGECLSGERKEEEQFSPTMTIVDAATQQLLDCVLLLHGEKPPEVSCRTLFCYIAVQVSYCNGHGSPPHPLYHMESKPCKQGKLPLIFCFHQPGTVCVIQVSIHSIVDSEGVEYMYHSEGCTCVVEIIDRKQHRYDSTDVHGVERVNEPPLVRYTGPLANANYHKIAQHFEKVSSKPESLQQFASKITSGDFSDDIKAFALCWKALIDIPGNPKHNEGLLQMAWDIASQAKCQNGVLLQGRVLRHWAHLQCVLGNYKEALQYISLAKQRFANAAHSNETASVIYTEILTEWCRLSSSPPPTAFSRLFESTERNYG